MYYAARFSGALLVQITRTKQGQDRFTEEQESVDAPAQPSKSRGPLPYRYMEKYLNQASAQAEKGASKLDNL